MSERRPLAKEGGGWYNIIKEFIIITKSYPERPCPVCGKPQRIKLGTRGNGTKKKIRLSTCGDKECISRILGTRIIPLGEKKKCSRCGKEFPATSQSAFCTAKCRENRDREKARVYLKKYRYKKKYGLSLEEVEEIKNKTNGLCEICGLVGNVIDHNHTTNKVRGWLCDKCNLGLSVLERSKDWLDKAQEYLLSH